MRCVRVNGHCRQVSVGKGVLFRKTLPREMNLKIFGHDITVNCFDVVGSCLLIKSSILCY